MTVDERDRLALQQRLEATLGAGPAETMMELLPPVGGTDLATKADLAALGARMDARFTTIDQRFESIDQRFESIDQRFLAIDGRFERLEHRFIGLEHRFEGLNDRIEGMGGIFRGEFGTLWGEIGTLRGDMKEGLAGVRSEIAAQTRTILFVVLATVISFGGLVLAATQLG